MHSLNIYAHALHELGKARANADDIFAGLREVYSRCQGGFACVAMITGFGILGFRDENGIRPLCFGSRPSGTLEGAMDYFMASESVALTQLGFTNIVDILPGQAVFIEKGGSPQFRQIVERKSYTPDIFEMVYFSRPDSTMDGISIHRSRQHMGTKLAEKVKEILGEKRIQEIDVVIPVPETSNTSAAVLASHLQKPLSNAFVKNRYTFRTFIMVR
jgi:amidophosphoribosyltransferase